MNNRDLVYHRFSFVNFLFLSIIYIYLLTRLFCTKVRLKFVVERILHNVLRNMLIERRCRNIMLLWLRRCFRAQTLRRNNILRSDRFVRVFRDRYNWFPLLRYLEIYRIFHTRCVVRKIKSRRSGKFVRAMVSRNGGFLARILSREEKFLVFRTIENSKIRTNTDFDIFFNFLYMKFKN